MCGRYSAPGDSQLERAFEHGYLKPPRGFEPNDDMRPTQRIPVFIERDGQIELHAARGGLIPRRWKQEKAPSLTLEARIEEIESNPMWRPA